MVGTTNMAPVSLPLQPHQAVGLIMRMADFYLKQTKGLTFNISVLHIIHEQFKDVASIQTL
jgi:hypothetical protein